MQLVIIVAACIYIMHDCTSTPPLSHADPNVNPVILVVIHLILQYQTHFNVLFSVLHGYAHPNVLLHMVHLKW